MARSFTVSQPLGPSTPSWVPNAPKINFLHPAYTTIPPFDCTFLALLAFDEGPGLHHGTALEACRIVARNIDGFLSASRDRADIQHSLDGAPFDDILTGQQYYFHAREPPYAYPICLSFRAWKFPHDNIPRPWKDLPGQSPQEWRPSWISLKSRASRRVIAAYDKRCCVSASDGIAEAAHLVPDNDWFLSNHMWDYTDDHDMGRGVNAMKNLVYLRDDLARAFNDAMMWVFAPKAGRPVAHFLSQNASLALCAVFHNIPALLPPRVPPELLYAHFAWAVLHSVVYPLPPCNMLIDTLTADGVHSVAPCNWAVSDREWGRLPTPPPPDEDEDEDSLYE